MIVLRVFNNNAVVVKTENDGEETEAVVIGPGLGFKRKVGDRVSVKDIEKIYYVQSDLQKRLLKILNTTKKEHLEIAETILTYAEKLGYEKTTLAIMSLTEHISFAIERYENDIIVPNLIINEIQSFYPAEYQIGVWAIGYIENITGVNLGKDEAGYIALHIINTVMNNNTNQTIDLLTFVSGVLQLIEDTYEISMTDNTFDKNRLITHLKFLGQRMFLKKVPNKKEVKDLYSYLLTSNPKHKVFEKNLIKYMKDNFELRLDTNEIVYVLIHVTKFLNNV